MTGAPAETMYKVSFKSVPGWTGASHALGLAGLPLLAPVLEEATMRRARGYLPVTRRSRQRLLFVNWGVFSLIPLTMVVWLAAAILAGSGDDQSPLFGTLVVTGLITAMAGLIGVVSVLPHVGPGGNVLARQPGQHESLVELRRVHPAFVAAVNQLHANRTAQVGLVDGSASPPGST
jgi:hypothetical protein